MLETATSVFNKNELLVVFVIKGMNDPKMLLHF
jgi:hypothetical protein